MRTQTQAPGPQLQGLYDSSTWEAGGWTFRANVELDDFQDISWIGTIYHIHPYADLPEGGERVDGRGGPVWVVPATEYREQDIERLRAYVREEWSLVGIVVTVSRNGIELGSASLWGIESDAGEYLNEVAEELAEEALIEARKALADLCAGR